MTWVVFNPINNREHRPPTFEATQLLILTLTQLYPNEYISVKWETETPEREDED